MLLGALLLMALLPNIGGIIAGPARHGEWRFGPFLFSPGPFFSIVGTIGAFTALTVFGIARRNSCEWVCDLRVTCV